ncbi:MAG: type II secretion system protein M [Granulosicoccus sp.]|nr:type II secretion system protein M [Granulosicoccus sp.]
MKEWYLRQSPRDRIIVMVVGFLCLLALLYALVWKPLDSRHEQLKRTLEVKEQDLQFVRRSVATLSSASGSTVQKKTSDKAPYLLIDQVIRDASLEPPQRVEPSGEDGARVQFNEVDFDRLVHVLAELELYGLQVSTMTITRKNQGTVSARFNMERS